jgi:TM2 domain-containing membrane protein YozV
MGTGYLAFAHLVKLGLDGVHKLVNGACGKGTFLTGFANTRKELISAEFLTPSILLNNEDIMWLYTLVSSEAIVAGEAFPSPPHSFI